LRDRNVAISVVFAGAAALAWVYTTFRAVREFAVPPALIALSITLTATACFGWLLVFLGRARGDHETHCRKCNHILRGISEPRCSECGERI
jgi:heme A synthase